ncbi:hypothetical protein CAPNMURICA_74 [Arthrobacter phage CapnMurica]|uniref:Uncharacterized protein n=1 Tax=Arthrobacter phage CapnMurica TaxID=1772294 RepID=A0A0U4JX20_9CAUD|nr:hypothetical protein FDH68_gp74 [Arthrobacter phage CaptnMurica]ALY08674.1 hypothetical protein CAPNMURICA_74 [Arthrobacter phage CaptnMurica]
MRFNFYKVIKYVWVLAFVITMFSFMLSWEPNHLLRGGFSVVMIVIFAVADAYYEDDKALTK